MNIQIIKSGQACNIHIFGEIKLKQSPKYRCCMLPIRNDICIYYIAYKHVPPTVTCPILLYDNEPPLVDSIV